MDKIYKDIKIKPSKCYCFVGFKNEFYFTLLSPRDPITILLFIHRTKPTTKDYMIDKI